MKNKKMKITVLYDECWTWYVDIEFDGKTISEDMEGFQGEPIRMEVYEVEKLEDLDCELIRNRALALLESLECEKK
jgi:hypothetical protein